MISGEGVQLTEDAFWDAEKTAFSELCTEARDQYAREASLSLSAADGRERRVAQVAAGGVAGDSAPSSFAQGPSFAIVPAGDLTMTPAAPVGCTQGTSVEDLTLDWSPGADDHPLSEGQLSLHLSVGDRKRKSMEGTAQEFVRSQLHIASGILKGEVQYPRRGRYRPFPAGAFARRMHIAVADMVLKMALSTGSGACRSVGQCYTQGVLAK